VREFYSILRAAIKEAWSIGRVDLLINDQTVPKIMGKMPFADWKEWATKRPECTREDMGAAFERYVERKRKDALNIAAAEPHGWEAGEGKVERSAWDWPSGDKPGGAMRKTVKATGTANVVMSGVGHEGRRCRFRKYTGCTDDHAAVSCKDFLALDLETKQRALEESDLCTFCKGHAVGSECYGQGLDSKPACKVPECREGYAEKLQDILAELNANVNLVTEEEGVEEENGCVNMARAEEQEGEEDGWPENVERV
jgi:hypothetical protein